MSIYQYSAEKADGSRVSLSEYKGKMVLIVNTASKCRFTPQFDDLQKLYNDYKDSGLEILGFPCNQFGEQEPGTDEEAAAFCQINYGVKFPIFAKIEVNGPNANDLFEYLKKAAPFAGFDESNIAAKLLKMMLAEKEPELLVGNDIKWNFTKFLIDQQGNVVKRFESPDGIDYIKQAIEEMFNKNTVIG